MRGIYTCLISGDVSCEIMGKGVLSAGIALPQTKIMTTVTTFAFHCLLY